MSVTQVAAISLSTIHIISLLFLCQLLISVILRGESKFVQLCIGSNGVVMSLRSILVEKGIKQEVVADLLGRLGLDAEDEADLAFITVEAMKEANIQPGLVAKVVAKLGLAAATTTPADSHAASPKQEEPTANDMLIAILAQKTGIDLGALKNPIKSVEDALKRVPTTAKADDRVGIITYLKKAEVRVVAYNGDDIVVELTVSLAGNLDAAAADNLVANGLEANGDYYAFRFVTPGNLWPDKKAQDLVWFSPFTGKQLVVVTAFNTATDDKGNDFGRIVFGHTQEEAWNRMAALHWMDHNGKVSSETAVQRRAAIGYFASQEVSTEIEPEMRAWRRVKASERKPFQDYVRHAKAANPSTEPEVEDEDSDPPGPPVASWNRPRGVRGPRWMQIHKKDGENDE